ncbi:Uncharacterised protein [Actinobaculum suis]|uniref:WCX domain-containing protein n=1 Tax=Actinobaculum suis TaxID=1657 RepID=A0A7Z8Y9D9_9ACTO|nr:WYL domain-containing protein [Actinobaculum suis]VDG76453.1 Uncharacterised protein [Actinobaculum suis]
MSKPRRTPRINNLVLMTSMLTYLGSHGPATLAELGQRFGISWKRALNLLWKANMAEPVNMIIPFYLDLPDPLESSAEVSAEVEEFRKASAESYVSLRGEPQRLYFGLDEALIIVALIDSLLEITPESAVGTALRDTRQQITQALAQAGFADAVWDEPHLVAAPEVITVLNEALADIDSEQVPADPKSACAGVEFSYMTAATATEGARARRIYAIPAQIVAGVNPLLCAAFREPQSAGETLAEDRCPVAATPEAGEWQVGYFRLDRIAQPRSRSAATVRELQESREIAQWAREKAAPQAGEGWEPEGLDIVITVTAAGRWAVQALAGARATAAGEGKTTIAFRARSLAWLMTFLAQVGEALVEIQPAWVAREVAARFARMAGNVPGPGELASPAPPGPGELASPAPAPDSGGTSGYGDAPNTRNEES